MALNRILVLALAVSVLESGCAQEDIDLRQNLRKESKQTGLALVEIVGGEVRILPFAAEKLLVRSS